MALARWVYPLFPWRCCHYRHNTMPIAEAIETWRVSWGACQTVGDDQAATAGTAISLSLAAMAGYHLVNRSRNVPSRVRVRVCRRKWAPGLDPCICCFLAKRRLTTRLTVD